MSKVTNIHLSAVAKLRNSKVLTNNKKYDEYISLYDFSRSTYEKNLLNLDLCVLFNYEYYDIQQAFKERFFKTYELWKEYYPCNILYTGTDTVCLRKCDVFGKYDEFRLFGVPDKMANKTIKELRTWNPHYAEPSHIFNCDIRYFPSTLTEEFWEAMLNFTSVWPRFWHVEQNIYNRAFVDQNITKESILESTKYGYQLPFGTEGTVQNGVTLDTALMVHFHSSKGIVATHGRMLNIWNKYN